MRHRLRRLSTALGSTAVLGAALAFAAPAQAGGWTEVSRAHYGIVYACKTPVSSGYGPLWRVTTFMSNYYSDHGHSGGVTVRRNDPYYGQLIHQWNVTLGPGQTSGYGTVYLSRVLPDYLVAGSGELNGQGSGGDVPIGYITYC
jgi:hypothetical protein